MKYIVGFLLVLLLGCFTALYAIRDYRYEKQYLNEWELADKSSTIPAKKLHIQHFISALEDGNKDGEFASYNALIFKTPNNGFRENMNALHTLNERLSEIEGMSPSSFEYNTAIQQITAQEQGEADQMLKVLKGCYSLSSFPTTWEWISIVIFLALLVGGGFVFMLTLDLD